jgi:L-threonylcarbamoyladenylate synthase
VPIAAPSANRSGRISPTAAADVAEELGGRVSFILDGGLCSIGLESTVVGFENDKPVLLRSGAIPRAVIERIAGPLGAPQSDATQSPGQMASHYAPRASLLLNAREVREGEALLAFGPNVPQETNMTRNLSAKGDLREAAANLFAMLRALDKSGARAIAVMPIPNEGLGEAINDRLQRAAARRE